ncbi:MAG TPA: YceI family protein [Gemmatimonadaceae bacterium]
MGSANTIARIFNGALFPLPGVYQLDSTHTFVDFRTQHLVIGHVRGRFDEVAGRSVVPEDPTQSTYEVTIATASVSTHNAKRDEDLRSPRFFDAERFPTMTYRGASVTPELDGRWTVTGMLTIGAVTLAVPLLGLFTGIVEDPMGNIRVGVHATAQASRKAFGLLTDLERESGGVLLGKDISITIDAEALLQV